MIRRFFLSLLAAAFVLSGSVPTAVAAGGVQQALVGLGGAAAVVDPDAQAWATAVTGAGGTYSAGDLSSLSAFITSAKAHGYWTKLKIFLPFLGDDGSLAAALRMWNGSAWVSATNHNFVSGDYTRATGLTGDGSSKYLDTGIGNSGLSANSTHQSAYVRSSTVTAGVTMGAITAVTNSRMILAGGFTGGVLLADQYDGGAGRLSASISGPFGFCLATRTSAALLTGYQNGVSVGTNTVAATTLNTSTSNFIFAVNNNNTGPALFIPHALGMVTQGDGFSSTDAANSNTDAQALMTAAGRNV